MLVSLWEKARLMRAARGAEPGTKDLKDMPVYGRIYKM
jgi:hypothetical protein